MRKADPAPRAGVLRGLALAALAALSLAAVTPEAFAGGIGVDRVELRWAEDAFQPVADFSIALNPAVEQALTHGVPLYFTGEFTLIRRRWYWLNEAAVQNEVTIKLSYNALTRQYRVSYGALYQNFNELDDALHLLGHQAFDPIPASSVHAGVKYVLSVRMHLDLGQLPKPLQINALVNTDWEMDSGWRSWPLNVAALPDRSRQTPLEFR